MKFNNPFPGTRVLAFAIMLTGSTGLQAAEGSQRFQDECSECHGTSAEFADEWLGFRDGALIGMGSEQPVSEYLKKHRDLTPDDIRFYVDHLTRVAKDLGIK